MTEPKAETQPTPKIDTERMVSIYRSMVTARQIDLMEEELVARGEAFFMVSGAGHEATAALAPFLGPQDWLHLHYRDKALAVARGMTPADILRGLLCKGTSHSRGRQMSAHLSDPALHAMSITGPVGNSGLQAAGVAAAVKDQDGNPIVYCSVGDGTTQEGEMLEGISEAIRWDLPVLFLVQDNEYAISTTTRRKTFYSTPDGDVDSYCGIPIRRFNGSDALACLAAFESIVAEMRETRKPVIAVANVKRLANHTNADDQRVYREEGEIRQTRDAFDPITILRGELAEAGVSPAALDEIDASVRAEVRAAAESVLDEEEPEALFEAARPLPARLTDPRHEYRGGGGGDKRLTMIEAMRDTLRHHMENDGRVILYGEDLEDPKGDVFGLTKGLSTAFPGRVLNSPLAEASIVGNCVGRALAGQLPVGFIQFADFLPIAYNQIISEMGSMYWRTDGAWQCPVILMVTCGGFRPGLGPFHAQTLESVMAHTPGVDVVMPSTAADAAGLLNAAFASGRPTIFFYPKSCLNDRARTTAPDVSKQLVPLGRSRTLRRGDHATVVAWGNCAPICEEAADHFAQAGVELEVIDLRSIMPWDVEAVVESAERTGKLLVVHEDNITCGFGAEVLATVAERAARPVAMKRIARPDTYVPCNFGNQLEVLPSLKRVLEEAAPFLGIKLQWDVPDAAEAGDFVVEAIGSSPSDESITVSEWHIAPGDEITEGQTIAECEADKAIFELSAPVTGVVTELLAEEGVMVKVGKGIAKVRPSGRQRKRQPRTTNLEYPPIMLPVASNGRPASPAQAPAPSAPGKRVVQPVLSSVAVRLGSRVITNEEVASWSGSLTPAEIVELTGIEERRWIGEGEDALTLAAAAATEALEAEGLAPSDLDLIVCSTGTPLALTPSTACRVLEMICSGRQAAQVAAFDVNAACSGFLYALQVAHDHIAVDPSARVMVLTTETLSPLVNKEDYGTAVVFGDGASACILGGEKALSTGWARLHRPLLSAQGEDGKILAVPTMGSGGCVHMNGKRVFAEAVRKMSHILDEACEASGLATKDLDLVIPHQANQRIIDAIQRRVEAPADRVYSTIRTVGNVSSTTIPYCLSQLRGQRAAGEKWGLCAFGGGFTYAAAILETIDY